jgi:hypothetical protein
MLSSIECDIHRHLSEYLDGKMSLADFQAWFVPATWNIHLTGEPGAQELAYEIDHRIAEFTSGHRTEDDLRALLMSLTTDYAAR